MEKTTSTGVISPSISPIQKIKLAIKNSTVLRFSLFAGIGIFSISIIFLVIVLIIGFTGKSKDENRDKIVIDNVDESIADEINRQIVYTSNSEGKQNYYSPTTDLLINFDNSKFRVSEGFNSIAISIRNVAFSFDVYGSISTFEVENINQVFIKKYSDLYDGTEVIEEKVEDDFTILKLKFPKKSYTEENAMVDEHHYVVSKKIDNKYVSIDFSHSSDFPMEDFKQDFKDILNSTEVSPDNVNQNSVVEISDPKLKFSFDIKKWELSGQSEYGSALTFRSDDFETDPNYKYAYTSIRISSFKMFGDIDEEYINENYITDEIENAQEFYGDKNLKLLTQNEKVEIDGVRFYKVSYSYDSYTNLTTKEIYIGYDKNTGNLIDVTISIEGTGTKGEEEVRKVFDTIEFFDEGAQIQNSNVLGVGTSSKTIEVQKSSVLGKLAVVHIFNRSCVSVTVANDPSLSLTGGKTYDGMCSAGFGSGFYISKDGYIATNSHVANSNPLDIIITSAQYSENDFLTDITSDLADIYESQGVDLGSLNENELLVVLVDGIGKLVDSEVLTFDIEYENYIEGKEVFEISRADLSLANAAAHKKAQTVYGKEIDSIYRIAVNNAMGTPDGIKVPDLTILKVDNKNSVDLPALKLGDPELITNGEDILAIGFPGSAENSQLFATEANKISTMTNGTISAIKPNFNSTFDLIQIDASISQGNSGGPIVNLDGDVIAVSTYGINTQGESADFNAGVSVEELITMIDEKNIENDIGQVSSSIITGLDSMAKEHYKSAIVDLNKAMELYPEAKEVLSPLIKVATQKIEAGEDKTPAFTIGDIELTQSQFNILIIAVIGVSVGIVLILGVIFLVLLSKLIFGGGKKRMPPPQNMQTYGGVRPNTMPYTQMTNTPPQSSPVNTQIPNHQSYMPPSQN